jgi:hypothetical protein
MKMKIYSLALLPILATVNAESEGWINNEELKLRMGDDITTKPAPRYSLNLDLPPSERWNDIAALYKVISSVHNAEPMNTMSHSLCLTSKSYSIGRGIPNY